MTVFIANSKVAGKGIFAERLAERGYDLLEYSPMNQVHHAETPDGVEGRFAHSYFLKSPPSIGKGRFRRLTRYDNGKRCFYVIGELPTWLPFKLVNHIDRSDARVIYDSLRIKESVEALQYLLGKPTTKENMNVLYNPQWLSPGVFSWGSIGPYAGTLTEVSP